MADSKRCVACADRPSSCGVRAFTLLELLIVIGILALLIAIAVPAMTHAFENQRRTNTLANMQFIQSAIESFQDAKTGNLSKKYFGRLPPDYFCWHKWRPVPPCPNPPGCWEVLPEPDPNLDDTWEPGEPIIADQVDRDDEGFERLNFGLANANIAVKNGVQRRMNGVWVPEDPLPWGDTPIGKDYRSIEALYFFINEFCPSGSEVLKHLSPTIITNDDVCVGFSCPEKVIFGLDPLDNMMAAPNGRPVDLKEVRDSWHHPLRYQVQRLGVGAGAKWRWVLRSAGPDGEFASATGRASQPISALMLEEEDKSDDIVLTGE